GSSFRVLRGELDVVPRALAQVGLLIVGQRPLHPGGRAYRKHAGRDLRARRHQRAGRDQRAFADLRAVHHDRADADQRAVPDRAAVKYDMVADRHTLAHHRRPAARVDVDDRVVLDVGVGADANLLDVGADDRAVPDAGAIADHDVADHHRLVSDPGPFAEL